MREDIFKKKHAYTANLEKKCKHKKIPPPPITFLMVRPAITSQGTALVVRRENMY